ncbi:MAG: hypothetical protein KJO76_01105 [Gammaproteobacteria bacterium]|nr:hypothetical protein [Gammaproteobacteria bacterium]MBT8443963.1 hypothetical protein [Gammaproteobacteria bacterium]NND36169.1 hypothetical protein [Gammaproteobacteria bacterium]
MTQEHEHDWQSLCRQASIDPDEVRLVYDRYEAYLRFTEGRFTDGRPTAGGSGEPISLAQWFRFYYREKTSEGAQAGPLPGGCSADGDAVNNACLKKPAEFLRVLEAYGRAGGVTG